MGPGKLRSPPRTGRLVSLCTDVPSCLRKKSGEETPLPIFPELGGDVCTQANGWYQKKN